MKHARLITRTPLVEQRPAWAATDTGTTTSTGITGSTLEVKITFLVNLVDRVITIIYQKESVL